MKRVLEIIGWQMLFWAWVYSACYIGSETNLLSTEYWYGFPNALVGIIGFISIFLATVYRTLFIIMK